MTTLIGVGLAVYVGRNDKGIAAGIGFSVGIMVLISVFELLPEAAQTAGEKYTGLAVLFAVLLMALLHWAIPHIHLVAEKGAFAGQAMRSAYLVALGLILHDFPEGFAMANASLINPSMGLLVALGIAAHNIPEEFAMAAPAVLLRQRGFLYRAALVSALAEPIGAVLGIYAVWLQPDWHGMFLAFAAGAMIFVSLHELVPMARRYRHPQLFLLGIAASALVYSVLTTMIPD